MKPDCAECKFSTNARRIPSGIASSDGQGEWMMLVIDCTRAPVLGTCAGQVEHLACLGDSLCFKKKVALKAAKEGTCKT